MKCGECLNLPQLSLVETLHKLLLINIDNANVMCVSIYVRVHSCYLLGCEEDHRSGRHQKYQDSAFGYHDYPSRFHGKELLSKMLYSLVIYTQVETNYTSTCGQEKLGICV